MKKAKLESRAFSRKNLPLVFSKLAQNIGPTVAVVSTVQSGRWNAVIISRYCMGGRLITFCDQVFGSLAFFWTLNDS